MNSPPWSENQEFVNELIPLLSETGGGERSNLMLNKPKKCFQGPIILKSRQVEDAQFPQDVNFNKLTIFVAIIAPILSHSRPSRNKTTTKAIKQVRQMPKIIPLHGFRQMFGNSAKLFN